MSARVLRITCVVSSLGTGGAERVLAMLASAWADGGQQVTVLTLDDGREPPRQPLAGNVVHRALAVAATSTSAWEAVRNNVRRLRTIRAALRASRPDVIVSFGDQTNVLVLVASAALGVPVVVSERTSPDHHEIGGWWRLLRRRAYPRAARVVVQTARTADAVRTWAGGRIAVLPNPVRPATAIAGRGDAREIVSVGRLVPSKAFDVLLRAFALASPSLREWRLTIVGDGPERPSLERLAVELGVADRVTFAGYVPAPEAALQRAALFVTTTRYEGFPNALAEAMASGLPVIATDCPAGPRELTLGGEAGVLVPVDAVDAVAAAMRRLGSDAAERARLGAAARAAMAPFEASRVVAQWQRLLLDVVDEAEA